MIENKVLEDFAEYILVLITSTSCGIFPRIRNSNMGSIETLNLNGRTQRDHRVFGGSTRPSGCGKHSTVLSVHNSERIA